jgi:hypothetical protein
MTPTVASSNAGYSSRSLPDKLGFKPGMAVAFIALLDALSELARSVDFADVHRARRWADIAGIECRYDAIHAFTTFRPELEGALASLQSAIVPDGMIWISWPKKASNVPTDITENVIRAEALKLDLVDIKVAAIDDVWSGLKLVIRKDRR